MQNNKKNILRSKKNTLAIKNILQNTLNCKIKEIKFKGIERLKKISEYNFKLMKVEVVLETNIKREIYLKIINKEKVQETIFCYWYFCEEKNLTNKVKNGKYYNKKATITEYKSKYYNYKKKFNIKFLNKNYKICKSSNIYFLDLDKYILRFNENKKGRFWDNFNIEKKMIFIGII